MRHAGVVDEDVDPSKMLLRRAHEPLAVLAARRVGDDAEHGPALRFPFANGLLQPLAVASRDYHGRAVLGQSRTDLPRLNGRHLVPKHVTHPISRQTP